MLKNIPFHITRTSIISNLLRGLRAHFVDRIKVHLTVSMRTCCFRYFRKTGSPAQNFSGKILIKSVTRQILDFILK